MEFQYDNNELMNRMQYVIGIFIGAFFVISLIPGTYDNINSTLISLILIQLIVSIIRVRIMNIVFEGILLFLGILLRVPFVFKSIGIVFFLISLVFYVFKIIAIPIAFIDFASFKNPIYYTQMSNFRILKKIRKTNREKNNSKRKRTKQKKYKSKFSNKNVQDAEFEEK